MKLNIVVLLLFFILFFSGQVFSQNIDSLIEVSKRLEGAEKAAIFLKIGNQHKKEHNIDESIKKYTEAINIYTQIDSSFLAVKSRFSLGRIYYGDTKYDKAINQFRAGLKIAQDKNIETLIPMHFNALGITYKTLGDYPKSLEAYQKALKEYEKTNNDKGLAATLSNIGIVYRKFGKFDKAMTFSKQALEKGKKFNDPIKTGKYLINISNLYDSKEQYDSALYYAFKSLQSFEESKNEDQISSALSNIGVTYEKMKDYTNAEKYLFEGLKVSQKTNYKISNIYFNLGDLYRIQNEHKKAIKYYNLAEENKKHSSVGNLSSLIYQNLSISYEALGDYKRAFTFHKKFTEIKDNLTGENVQKEIELLSTKYETEKKNHVIDILEKESEIKDINHRKNLMIAGFIGFAFLLLSMAIYFSYKNKLEKSKTNEAVFQQRLLRSQMNPHFLFNALFSIQGFMMKNGAKPASHYLSTFAKLMRSILENSQKENITLEEEISTIDNYLALEKLRHPHIFDYRIEVLNDLETDITLIPPMLTQPFIENAVKHGVQNLDYKGEIEIVFANENDELIVTIKDNGRGFHKSNNKSNHKSASLKITKQRLRLLNKGRNKIISFKIEDINKNAPNKTGTIVTFRIPFKESEY